MKIEILHKLYQISLESGARWVVLDTNGGTLPNEIYDIASEVVKIIPVKTLVYMS